MKHLIAVVLVLILTAGCGKGESPASASISARSSEDNTATKTSESSAAKELSMAKEASVNVQMPAFPILANAMTWNVNRRGADLILRMVSTDKNPNICSFVENMRGPKETSADAYRLMVAIATNTYAAWPGDAFKGFGSMNMKFVAAYTTNISTSIVFSNELFTRLESKVGTEELSDPEDASEKIKSAFKEISADEVKAMCTSAYERVKSAGGALIDGTSGKGVGFSYAGLGGFSGDATGMVWNFAGKPWFGAAAIDGATRTIEVASSTSMSMNKSTRSSDNTASESSAEKSSEMSVSTPK